MSKLITVELKSTLRNIRCWQNLYRLCNNSRSYKLKSRYILPGNTKQIFTSKNCIEIIPISRLKPSSYFLRMRMRCEFDVNLTSQPALRSDIRKWVEQSWTAANYLLRICDINIRFAFARSMNRALSAQLLRIRCTARAGLWCQNSLRRMYDELQVGFTPWLLTYFHLTQMVMSGSIKTSGNKTILFNQPFKFFFI